MKMLLDREKSFTTLRAAARRWASSTAATLTELLTPELAEGESLPDLVLLQKLFVRALERRWRRLEEAHETWWRKKDRRERLVAERAAATATLYRELVDLRHLVRGALGAGSAHRLLRLGGITSRDPLTLLRQAARAAARLGNAGGGFRDAGRGRWAAAVRAAAETLRTVLQQCSLAAKEVDVATAERRRTLEDFNLVFVRTAGWLEGTYRAAGRDDRGQAVRPSRRRRGLLLRDARQSKPRVPAESAPEPRRVRLEAAAEPRSQLPLPGGRRAVG